MSDVQVFIDLYHLYIFTDNQLRTLNPGVTNLEL